MNVAKFYSKRSIGMSLPYADVKGGLVSLLAEIGLVKPDVEASVDPSPPLSSEQELLLRRWRLGQIEPEAWQRHLDDDPVLAAHVRELR